MGIKVKIGELALAADCAVDTVRYYERVGLLPEPVRTDTNYRVYGDAHLERLSFIRRCRSLDMALNEIRELLGFKDAPSEDCGRINALLDEHIGHVSARIAELRTLEQSLIALRARCAGGVDSAHCGILSGLVDAADAAGEQAHAGHITGSHVGPHRA